MFLYVFMMFLLSSFTIVLLGFNDLQPYVRIKKIIQVRMKKNYLGGGSGGPGVGFGGPGGGLFSTGSSSGLPLLLPVLKPPPGPPKPPPGPNLGRA